MSIILFILLLIVQGLILGALARLILPGRDPMSIGQTILIGIVGSLVAGLLMRAITDAEGAGFLASLVVTVGLVFAVRKMRERKHVGTSTHRPLTH